MDLMELTVAEITRRCVTRFQQAQLLVSDDSLEHRLADFHLLVDATGALFVEKKASADPYQLVSSPVDRYGFQAGLVMLYQELDDYCKTKESGRPWTQGFEGIDTYLGNMAIMASLICTPDPVSHLFREADDAFDPEQYKDLKRHLESIIVLRPSESGHVRRHFEQRIEELTPMQQHLVQSNLRRRNRFVHAQRRVRNLTRARNDFCASILAPGRKSNCEAASQEGPEASATRAQVSRIYAPPGYPIPKVADPRQRLFQCPCCCQVFEFEDISRNDSWWRHLVHDLQPFTCVVDQCPAPNAYYSTREALERHIKQDHPPTVQCMICTQGPVFARASDALDHLSHLHEDAFQDGIQGGHISHLLSRALSGPKGMGINACPLCDVTGPCDSPELIYHVFEHVHRFSLRSLPWPRSSQVKPGGEVGTYDLENEGTAYTLQWLDDVEDESLDEVDSSHLQPWEVGRKRSSPTIEEHDSQISDFDVHLTFAEEEGQGSLATDVSEALDSIESSSVDELRGLSRPYRYRRMAVSP